MKKHALNLFLSSLILISIFTASCAPQETAQPSYETADCLFTAPKGYNVECGYLSVPEDRSNPDSPVIKIYFAIFRSKSSHTEPDPIVYLAGGPGENALEASSFVFEKRFASLMENRDLIIVDQRGTGYSEPSLFCQEMIDNYYTYLDAEMSDEEGISMQMETIRECYDRFVSEGINLNCYNSAESASDLNDLRIALGYEEWNLLGVSYGTRLALTAMRDHPEGIRSVILGSTVPVQVDFYEETPDNINRALDTFYDSCAANLESAGAYPDLEDTLYDAMDKLNESPATLSVTHPLTGETYDILIDGNSLLSIVFEGLYSSEVIPLLPKIIYDAGEGKYDTLAVLMSSDLVNMELVSSGMHYSVQFSEEYPFNDPEQITAAIAQYPEMKEFLENSIDLGGNIYEIEAYWNTDEPDPVEDEAVVSDIPTLILAGEYDPVTPPSWGQLAAETLKNSYYYEFPGLSHDAVLSGRECVLDIILGFLDDPKSEPDGACISGIEKPDFITLEVELAEYKNTLFGFSSVYPENWQEIMPGAWQRSSLGITALIQQAAPGTNESMIALLAESIGIEDTFAPVGTKQANGLEWSIYEAEIQGLITNLIMAEKNAYSYIILFSCVADDYDFYYNELLLPVIDAYVPSE